MVVAVYLLIRTYQQLYALIKSGNVCFFLHVIILIATMVPAKSIAINCLQFFSLAKLLSKYVSGHKTSRYIGEIKTRSADLNFMEVGSLSDTLAKFTKRKIQFRDIVGFCLI